MNAHGRKSSFARTMPNPFIRKYGLADYDHAENFRNLVAYLARLKRNGDIDDDTFDKLVRQSAATFVETEISDRIGNLLGSRRSLERLLEIL